MFEFSKLSKLKAAQLDEIIKMYKDGGFEYDPEDVKTNTDKINTIKVAFEKCGGYPHIVTEDDLKRNDIESEDGSELKVGDVIFLPVPNPTTEVKEALMKDAETLLAGTKMTTEEIQHKLTELDLLSTTEELVDAVNGLRAELGQPQAPSDLVDPSKGIAATGKPVRQRGGTTEDTASSSVEAGLEETSPADLLKKAILTGNFVYENATIIGFQPKIVFGKTRYELYGADGATYTIDKEAVPKLVKSVL